MSRIYTDPNGLQVNAVSALPDGTDVAGNLYQVVTQGPVVTLLFQSGDPEEKGVNGATNEALIAVLIHRLRHQDAKQPCKENESAIGALEQALQALHARAHRIAHPGVGLESDD